MIVCGYKQGDIYVFEKDAGLYKERRLGNLGLKQIFGIGVAGGLIAVLDSS